MAAKAEQGIVNGDVVDGEAETDALLPAPSLSLSLSLSSSRTLVVKVTLKLWPI